LTQARSWGADLARDLAAGVTVGLVSIPQAVAFALVAGVPTEAALATMIVPGLVAGAFRDSPHLAPGATNTAALLVGAVIATSPLVHEAGVAPVLGTLCLVVGVTKLAVGGLRLGRLARYVSPAVVQGFTLGAAVLLVLGQLPGALGIAIPPEAGGGESALGRTVTLVRHLSGAQSLACAFAAGALAAIALLERLAPRVPGALVALVLSASVVALFGWADAPAPPLALLGAVPGGLPALTPPLVSLRAFEDLAVPALAIALVGMTEVVSIGKAIAARTGRPLRANRELAAQGVANLASAFFGCLPSSISWTRSAVSLEAGARTRFAVIAAALTVALLVLVAAPLLRFVPQAAVAGVVLWIAARMVRPRELARTRRSDRADFFVLLATALATLALPLPVAVLVGVALSLGLVIHRASLLHVSELQRTAAGHLAERPVDGDTGKTSPTLLQLEGDLFFGVADELESRLEEVAARGTRAIVLRVRRTHAIDGAAAEALARFVTRFRARGGVFALCGLRPSLEPRVRRSGLADALGEDAIFEPGERPFAALERALERVQARAGLPAGLAQVRAAREDAAEPSWSI